jgi:class 3 adenylate cyclase
MICASCGQDNPPSALFCARCGAALAVRCPNCSAVNAADARFCIECGSGLTDGPRAAAPTRAERRLVTVLFADIVGFTPFSEGRDPEDVREMLTGYFERSREIIEGHGGTIDKFIGDAVMAWWGAVEAREDDAERAVRAGLRLVDMVSGLGEEIGAPGLALRAGVLSGETSVGPGGNLHGLVVGDMVNTASRLQSIAAPGTVVVGEATRDLVGGNLGFEPLEEQRVKGKAAPVRAYRAIGVVAGSRGRASGGGVEPPFTGRQEELRLLTDQLHAVQRDRQTRLVSIVGEGGIGKTRLALELQRHAEETAEPISWHRGRSPSFGDGVALWSLGEMVRGWAGIGEDDDRTAGRLRLSESLENTLTLEDERRWVEPRLAALLGLQEMPPGDREDLFTSLRILFQRIAERGTTVLVFEDAQWADDGVFEFITELAEQAIRHPIFLITLARPELLRRIPGWGSDRRNTLSVRLAPLSPTDMKDMIEGTAPDLPADTVTAIVERAGGVPLYAVEFVRMLLARGDQDDHRAAGGLAAMSVPDSLSAVIGARLDRLSPDERSLVGDAAVIGHVFSVDELVALGHEASVRERVRALVRREIFEVDDDPGAPQAGRYRFVQGLIREVAYGRLSRADRRSRHLKVAEHLASRGDPELAGLVAGHFVAAGELVDGGDTTPGRVALVAAAERASELQADAQALGLYRQALALASSVADRAPILAASAAAAGAAGRLDEATELANEAVAALEEAGDREGVLEVHTALGAALASWLRAPDAVALLRPVYDSIESFDTPARVRLGLQTARAHMISDEDPQAIEAADRALPAAERLLPMADVLEGTITRATALIGLHRLVEAEVGLAGAVTLADRLDLRPQAVRALNNLRIVQYKADPMAAFRTSEELFERAERYGHWAPHLRMFRVWPMLLVGRPDEAVAMVDDLDPERLPPTYAALGRGWRLVIEGYRMPDPTVGTRLRREIDGWQPSGDAAFAGITAMQRMLSLVYDRDWAGVCEATIGTAVTWAVEGALSAAVRLRDAERVAGALNAVANAIAPGSLLDQGLRGIGEGALALLAGDPEQGAARIEAALGTLDQVALPYEKADWRSAAAALLGRDHPLASGWAEQALAWIREAGALGLERVWAEGLPTDGV